MYDKRIFLKYYYKFIKVFDFFNENKTNYVTFAPLKKQIINYEECKNLIRNARFF